MSVKIRIEAAGPGLGSGLFGLDGEIPVGTEIDLTEEPTGWGGRYTVLSRSDDPAQTAITNPAKPTYEAKHRGAGSYSILDADGNEVGEKLSKADAEAFNDLSDEDKAAFVASLAKPAE